MYRAIETSAQSGAKGIKFFFTYDISKSTTPELRKSTQKTDGWFIVLPEYGMAVDSYEYSFSGSINRGYVGSAKYRFGNSQAVLISSKMDTYESNKLVLSREFSDIDFAYGVEINELFLLSHYGLPDFVGIDLPVVPFWTKSNRLILIFSVALLCLSIASVFTYIIRKRSKSSDKDKLKQAKPT